MIQYTVWEYADSINRKDFPRVWDNWMVLNAYIKKKRKSLNN